MTRKSYIFNGIKDLCSGCGACVQICPHSAMSMQPDQEGFIFPTIDESKCIGCGACDRTCPVVNNDRSNQYNDQISFIATTNIERYYKESATIGICTMVAENVLRSGGVVYGAYLDEKCWKAYHIKLTEINDLGKIRNSKYLQSETRETFKEVKKCLVDGQTVLYIGTPCQIAGLKSFLNRDFSNLYTIDIICHGVFSPKLMPLEVNYWEKKFNAKVINFKFRSKRKYKHVNGGMVNFDLVMKNGELKHIERFAGSSPSYKAYAYSGDGLNYNLRLSCYSCRFRAKGRYGDISVGDPWFVENRNIENKSLDSHNCIRSIFSVNSDKGRDLFSNISDNLLFEQLDMEVSFCQPAVKMQKRKCSEIRASLYSRINNEEYSSVIEDLLQCNLEKEHITFEKLYYKNRIKRFLKKILLFK